jgi:hypothetical protein
MEASVARVEARLDAMDKRLDAIEALLHAIAARLDGLHDSCAHMDDHIEFVNGVYTSLRHPLNYIAAKFSGARALPEARQ